MVLTSKAGDVLGSHTFTAIYTPQDTNNYESAKVSLQVTVEKKETAKSSDPNVGEDENREDDKTNNEPTENEKEETANTEEVNKEETTTQKAESSIETGRNSYLLMWGSVMLVSLAGMRIARTKQRKHNK